MNTYEITHTLVDDEGDGKIIIIEGVTIDFVYRSIEFFVEHRDKKIQDKGQDALKAIMMACSMRELNDSGELLGKFIDDDVFERVASIVNVKTTAKAKPIATATVHPKTAPTLETDARFVYVISCLDSPTPLCKVGIAGSAEKRLKTLSTASPHVLRLELARHATNARSVETLAHAEFAHLRRNGEWFELPASTAIEFVNRTITEGQA